MPQKSRRSSLREPSALEMAEMGDIPGAISCLVGKTQTLIERRRDEAAAAPKVSQLMDQREELQTKVIALSSAAAPHEPDLRFERERQLETYNSELVAFDNAIVEADSQRQVSQRLDDFAAEARDVLDYLPSDHPRVKTILNEIGDLPLWGIYSPTAPPVHKFEGSLYGHLDRQPLAAIQIEPELRKLQFRLGELLDLGHRVLNRSTKNRREKIVLELQAALGLDRAGLARHLGVDDSSIRAAIRNAKSNSGPKAEKALLAACAAKGIDASRW